jgi:large subunit ribosomal protein L21
MYAIVETGGKQYRVREGGMLHVEKLPGEPGDEVVLDKVLLLSDAGDVRVGTPYVEATVTCEVVEQDRGKKVIVFKHKKRKDYRKKAGHRQDYTALKVKSIQA